MKWKDHVLFVANTKLYTQNHKPLPPLGYLRFTSNNKWQILPDKACGLFPHFFTNHSCYVSWSTCYSSLLVHHLLWLWRGFAAFYKQRTSSRRTLLFKDVGARRPEEPEENHSRWVWTPILCVPCPYLWLSPVSGLLLWKVLPPAVFDSWKDYKTMWPPVCVGWQLQDSICGAESTDLEAVLYLTKCLYNKQYYHCTQI